MAYNFPVDASAMSGAEFSPDIGGEGGQSDFQFRNAVCADEHYRGVRSITFDPYEELLWICTDSGRLTSYIDMSILQKYVSVEVSSRPLCGIAVNHPNVDSGVYTIDAKTLYYYSKFGRRKHLFSHRSMSNLVCLLNRPFVNQVILGGRQNTLVCMDTTTGSILREAPVDEGGCVILKESNRFICGAGTNGKVMLFDPSQMRAPVSEFQAHTGQLSDMTVQENMLVTCGWSVRQNGAMVPDRILKVYDIRFNRMLQPLSMMAFDPCFVRFVPILYNSLLVISSFGHYQFLDIGNTMSHYKYHSCAIAGTQVTDIALSSSCRVMGISDDAGYVHVYSHDASPQINRDSLTTEIPDLFNDYGMGPLGFDEHHYPLTAIPFGLPNPDPSSSLASDWPEKYAQVRHRLMAPIEQELLDSVQVKNGLRLAKKPASWGRVHFPYRQVPSDSLSLSGGFSS